MLRRFLTISIAFLFTTLLLSSCGNHADASNNGDDEKTKSVAQKITLDIKGMTCSGCEYSVESALKKVEGVKKVDADAGNAIAVVEYDPKVAKVEKMVEAVNKTGYKATAPEKNKKKDKKEKREKE